MIASLRSVVSKSLAQSARTVQYNAPQASAVFAHYRTLPTWCMTPGRGMVPGIAAPPSPLPALVPTRRALHLSRILLSQSPSSPSQAEHAKALARLRQVQEARKKAANPANEGAIYLFALVIGMVGATYGAVPLYRMFCQATGYGGTVQRKTIEEKIADHEAADEEMLKKVAERQVRITFNSDVADGLDWKFTPTQKEVRTSPGQTVLAFYTATNRSDHAVTGVSTYNVSPMKAGVHFNKIQCFCFEEQRLRPHETIDMPVFFYLDPEFAIDPKMRDVDTLTLSYTFFKVEEKEPLPAEGEAVKK